MVSGSISDQPALKETSPLWPSPDWFQTSQDPRLGARTAVMLAEQKTPFFWNLIVAAVRMFPWRQTEAGRDFLIHE